MSKRIQGSPKGANAQAPRSAPVRPKGTSPEAAKKSSVQKPVQKGAGGRGGISEAMSHHDEAVATEVARTAYSRERYEFLLRTDRQGVVRGKRVSDRVSLG